MQNKISVSLPVRGLSDSGRVFPYGVRVSETAYGLGVFAYAFIPKGTPIARVPGKIIIDPEYSSEYCIDAGNDKVLEPAPPFCYLNHACEPNCLLTQYVKNGEESEGEELEEGNLETQDLEPDDDEEEEFEDDDDELGECDDECFFGDGGADEVEVDADVEVTNVIDDVVEFEPEFEDDVDSEIWVETLRDILPGEQLTIDYAWAADKAVKCQCGCKNCRGWIVAADELELIKVSSD
ncbi:MAG: hypothetical protein LBJ00_03990 [Planctomycetaceae bacterium]|jgi:hypothetical protein|nr:hypothetical protein [Planctomycetaceae bacterium]